MDVVHNNYVTCISDDGPWHVKYKAPKRLPGRFFNETCKALEMIWEQRVGQVYVLFGGGLDTEYLLQTMAHLKMNAVPVVIRYKETDNNESVKRVKHFSDAAKWNHYVFDISLTDFINDSSTYHMASQTQCSDYRLLPLFSTAARLNGTVLSCIGNPPNIGYNGKLGIYTVQEQQQLRSAAYGWMVNKIHGTPFALSYTAEQFFSFLDEPVTVNYTAERSPSLKSMNEIRSSIYNSNEHFSLGLRKRLDQFYGYKPPFDVRRIEALGYDGMCKFEFHTLKRHLRAQIP